MSPSYDQSESDDLLATATHNIAENTFIDDDDCFNCDASDSETLILK